MALKPSEQRPGTKIVWPIGAQGSGSMDDNPCRVVEVAFGYDDRGRQGLVATVIQQVTARPENGGHTYPRIRNILARYLDFDPRADIAGFDDVDINALWDQANGERRTFLMTPATTEAATAETEALVAAGTEVVTGSGKSKKDALPFD